MKIMCIFGTRPEAIKMAPLVKAIALEPHLSSIVCVTGQHRAMLDQVLDVFGIVPDIDLNVMQPNQTLNGLMARLMTALDPVLDAVRPDRVLVHGDTTTALAAAIASFHRRIPVGHVEAGLRTYDPTRPWPEEMNRQVVDRFCDMLFAPTRRAADHLAGEHIAGRVLVTGNTVIDALLGTVARIQGDPDLKVRLDAMFTAFDPRRRVVLVTGHRRENFGERFAHICDALATLSGRGDVEIVYPVHPNPMVRDPAVARLSGLPHVHLPAPLDYVPFVEMMRRATVILTDSGGVQEEAPSLGKPVLVMRDVTERPEALATGMVRLVGTDRSRIVAAVSRVLDDPDDPARTAPPLRFNPYGDGRACRRIVDALCGRGVEPFAAVTAGIALARASDFGLCRSR